MNDIGQALNDISTILDQEVFSEEERWKMIQELVLTKTAKEVREFKVKEYIATDDLEF